MDDAEGEDDERDPQAPPAWASFNMNYFRPHFFGNEAAIELEDFAARFGRSVCDPQIDGMGDPGELSKGAFLEGWNSGNKLAYGLMAEQGMSAPLRPAAELERIWQWNYARARLQAELGQNVYVPRISFFEAGGTLVSALCLDRRDTSGATRCSSAAAFCISRTWCRCMTPEVAS